MTQTPRNLEMDRKVEYRRHQVFALLAALGAYFSLTQGGLLLLPYAIVLMLGAIIQAFFLPYKKAALSDDDWGTLRRLRALRILLHGLALGFIPSLWILIDNSTALVLLRYQESFPRLPPNPFDSPFVVFVSAIVLGAGLAGTAAYRILSWALLRSPRFGEEEIRAFRRISMESSSLEDWTMPLTTIFAVSYLAAGWASQENPDMAQYCFLCSTVLVLLLIALGSILIDTNEDLTTPTGMKTLQALLLLSVIVASISLLAAETAIVLVLLISFDPKRKTVEMSLDEHLSQKEEQKAQQKKKRERELSSKHLVAFVFYRMHPRAEAPVLLCSFALFIAIDLWLLVFHESSWLYLFALPALALYFVAPWVWILTRSADETKRISEQVPELLASAL